MYPMKGRNFTQTAFKEGTSSLVQVKLVENELRPFHNKRRDQRDGNEKPRLCIIELNIMKLKIRRRNKICTIYSRAKEKFSAM